MELKLIYIEWCDAIEAQTGWETIEVISYWAKTSDWIVSTCGFLLEETDEYLVFASQVGDYHGDNKPKFSGMNKIPKTWIRKRIDLTELVNCTTST